MGLMRLLAHRIFPDSGTIFVPSHLRVFHVCLDPHILAMSAWHNLTLGCTHPRQEDPLRMKRILEQFHLFGISMHLDKEWALGFDALDEISDCHWADSLTSTEKHKFCLARAFIMNPEVMAMQRPL